MTLSVQEQLEIQIIVHSADQSYETFYLDELRAPNETNQQLLGIADQPLILRVVEHLRNTQNAAVTRLGNLTVSRVNDRQWVLAPKPEYGKKPNMLMSGMRFVQDAKDFTPWPKTVLVQGKRFTLRQQGWATGAFRSAWYERDLDENHFKRSKNL
jgi:hypothetical protein